MPSFKTAGKSKEDLAVVAQISGLLNAEETAGMTRAQLVKTIRSANDLAENTDVSGLSHSTAEKNDSDEQIMSDKEEPQETTAGKTRRTAPRRAASASQTATKKKTTRGRKKTISAASESTDQAKDSQQQQAEDSSGQMTENEDASKKAARKTSGRTRKSAASSASKTSARKTPVRKTKSAQADTGLAASDQKSKSDHQTAAEESAADSSDTKATGTRKRATAKKDTAARTRKAAQSKTAENDSEKQTPADKKTAPASTRRSSAAKRKSAAKKETADEKDTGTPEKASQDLSVDQAKADSQKTSISTAGENQSSAQAQSVHDQAKEDKKEAVDVRNEATNSASDDAVQTDDKDQAEKVLARKAEEKQQVIKFMPKKTPANEKPGKKPIQSDDASPEAASAAADQEQDNRASKPERKDFTEQAKNTHDKGRYGNRQQNKSETRTETKSEQKTETRQPQSADIEQVKGKRPHVEAGEVQSGVLEIMPDGYGFLRRDNYLQGSKDIYVPPQYIRRFSLRQGDFVVGPVKLQRESDRYQALLYIKEVNGLPPEKMQRRPNFDKLTPIYPDERLVLESGRNELSTRIIDLVAPIGKGQRGMIVSPPKAGKTILLQKIANAISLNNPEAKLIVLLIDERPEEVTDMQRTINGEVVYSTFDKTPENHTRVVELVLERAMRLVELDQDVVILLDSMTRLARAYNLTINPTGRTLSGGLDPGALYGPKRFFGAARNIENGGSLTIISTSLIETGSRMDEVIFEEFKGTGNMEVYLDRKLSEKRIFPAIDINKSGTRREELLLTERELDAVWKIRKAFSQLDTAAVTEAIMGLLLKTQNNEHFTASINVTFSDKNMYDSMRGNKSGQNGQQGSNGQYNKTSYTSR